MSDKSGRYYWLKLKRDFFKRHDIRIVEEMTNGKEYILFYLKLLCESVDHDGSLRFSDEVPYNDEMLSVITNTNIDIVRSAVKVFTELRMMEILDDGTLYLREVETMIGSASASENALRQARYRERKKEDVTLPLLEHNTDVTKSNESKRKSKSKRQSKSKNTIPPSLEEVTAYCNERKNNIDPQTFIDFYQSKGWMVGKNHMKDWKACIRTWERSDRKHTDHVVIEPPEYIKPPVNWDEEELPF